MAGCAGAGSATLRHDPGNRVLDRCLHDSLPGLSLNLVNRPVMLDISDLHRRTAVSLDWSSLCKGDRGEFPSANSKSSQLTAIVLS
jgi:hypothetical protein